MVRAKIPLDLRWDNSINLVNNGSLNKTVNLPVINGSVSFVLLGEVDDGGTVGK